MSVQQVFDAILGQAGVIVLLLVIFWSGWKRMWVYGSYYTEMQAELRGQIDKLEKRLDRAGRLAEAGTTLADRAARLAEERRGEESNGGT